MPGMMFSLFAYTAANVASVALILFMADLWLPQTVNGGLWSAQPLVAVLVDLGLIALFGLQHSVMARPAFKRWLTAKVPAHLERSVYVLAAAVMLGLLIGCWQPIPIDVWRVENETAATLLWVLYALGWMIVMGSTYMINHYELFGLAQAFRHWRGLPKPNEDFRTPLLYRYVRHPLYFGFLLAFWATPRMTLGHLLFAVCMTLYILIGIAFEERDLIRLFGERYRDYRAKVPALIPGFKPYRQG